VTDVTGEYAQHHAGHDPRGQSILQPIFFHFVLPHAENSGSRTHSGME
jgi:hypothetical protein